MAGGAYEPQQARKIPEKEHHIFTVGSWVEVLTEEQDYGGVFYAATVVESTPSSQKTRKRNSKNDNKLYVEYQDLVVEEGGSEHLREYVDISMVRPKPPPSSREGVGGCFEVGELVDALYNDGWWTGVVTRLVKGGGESSRVIVTFPHPPDVRAFGVLELRPHLKWVDGSWVTPEKQAPKSLMNDGVHGRDQALKISTSVAVAPKSLMNDDAAADTAITEVYRRRKIESQKFSPQVHDHPKASGENTNVKKFDVAADTAVMGAPGFNFFDRTLSKYIKEMSSIGNHPKASGENTNVKNFDAAVDTVVRGAPDLKFCDGTLSKCIKKQISSIGNHPKPSGENTNVKNCDATADTVVRGAPGLKFCDGALSKSVKKEISSLANHAKASGEKSNVKSCDATAGTVVRGAPDLKFCDGTLSKCIKKEISSIGNHPKASGENTNVKNCDAAADTVMMGAPGLKFCDGPLSKCMKEVSIGSQDLGTPKDKCMKNDKTQRHGVLLREDKFENNQKPSASAKEAVFDIQKTSRVVNCVTQRRNSPEPQASSMSLRKLKEGDVSGARQQFKVNRTITEILSGFRTKDRSSDNLSRWKIDGRSLETETMKFRRKDGIQSPMSGNSQNGDINSKSAGKNVCVPEKVVIVIDDDDVLPKQENIELDSDKFFNDVSSPKAKASVERTNEEKCYAKAERVVTRALGVEFRNQPLLKCMKDMLSPPIAPIGSLTLENPKDKCMENEKAQSDCELLKEEKLENCQQPSASFVPSNEARLPFVKDSDLWKTIEAMEAFKKIPQKPHFRPLEKFAECSRQGLAIGLMTTCATVMKEASNLCLSDPKSITDSFLEALTELETHGFNVRVVKDCVNDFIAVKDKQRDYLESAKKLNYNGKKRRNSEELDVEGKKCSNFIATQTISQEINFVSESSDESKHPVNGGLPVADMGTSESRVKKARGSGSIEADNLLSDREHRLNNSTTQEKEDGRSLETETMKFRRKDGIQSPMSGNSQNGDINSQSAGKNVCVQEKVVIVIDDNDVLPKQENIELDSGKFSNDVSSPKAKAFGEFRNEEKCDAKADLVTGALGIEFHNRPLSKCMKEMLSPPIVPLGSLNLEIPKDKYMENEKAQSDCELLEMEKLENCQKPSSSFVPSNEARLPFVKDSDLWKTIEAMEAFKKIPQKPHFRPLEKIAERSRQGYAIGLMVNCASVMEEALNLRLSDPKSITDSILEMLTELETHGFDVRVVKDRINDFIAMKHKQHDYLESVKKLDYKILERDGKRRKNIEELGGEASEESQLLTLSDLEHLGMDKVTSASDTVSLPNSQLPSSNNTNIESEMASVMDSLYTQPHVYLRTFAFEKMVQAVSLAGGLWTVEIVEQTLRDLGVKIKPTVPTKEVCAEHLELRKEILTLLNLQKQLEYKDAETPSETFGA